MSKYGLGFDGEHGSIDPIEGFEVSDDLSSVTVYSSVTTTLGSRISQTEDLTSFLTKNPSFYAFEL